MNSKSDEQHALACSFRSFRKSGHCSRAIRIEDCPCFELIKGLELSESETQAISA